MSTRRVLGGFNGSTIGLRTTLFGFDARYDDADDVTKFSFNSDWTDIARVHMAGIVAPPSPYPSAIYPYPSNFTTTGYDAADNPWLVPVAHSLGYAPFVEARKIDGYTVYDDHRTDQGLSGSYAGEKAWSFTNMIKLNTAQATSQTNVQAGESVFYIMYELAMDV